MNLATVVRRIRSIVVPSNGETAPPPTWPTWSIRFRADSCDEDQDDAERGTVVDLELRAAKGTTETGSRAGCANIGRTLCARAGRLAVHQCVFEGCEAIILSKKGHTQVDAARGPWGITPLSGQQPATAERGEWLEDMDDGKIEGIFAAKDQEVLREVTIPQPHHRRRRRFSEEAQAAIRPWSAAYRLRSGLGVEDHEPVPESSISSLSNSPAGISAVEALIGWAFRATQDDGEAA